LLLKHNAVPTLADRVGLMPLHHVVLTSNDAALRFVCDLMLKYGNDGERQLGSKGAKATLVQKLTFTGSRTYVALFCRQRCIKLSFRGRTRVHTGLLWMPWGHWCTTKLVCPAPEVLASNGETIHCCCCLVVNCRHCQPTGRRWNRCPACYGPVEVLNWRLVTRYVCWLQSALHPTSFVSSCVSCSPCAAAAHRIASGTDLRPGTT
jgi:hypothetical protein